MRPGLLTAALIGIGACAGAVAAGADNPWRTLPGGEFASVLRYEDTGGKVVLPGFALQQRPVTNAEYLAFVRQHPRWQRGKAPGLFVEQVVVPVRSRPATPGWAYAAGVLFVVVVGVFGWREWSRGDSSGGVPPPQPSPASGAGSPELAAALPRLADLPAAERNALPPLKITMHVFADDPAQRFVILDGRRHAEGATPAEGVVIREIRRDGLVLSLRGRDVLLPRP